MNCNINHSLFLRSNGSLACWCDAGSLKTIQEFDPCIDYADDVYLGKIYRAIRESLAAGKMPFPSFCSRCMVLLPMAPFIDTYVRDRYVEIQVEPSMACQLDCPGCIPMKGRRTHVDRTWAGHLMLAPKILEKILRDFRRAKMRIGVIDFQGHGEPLLNPDAWNMMRISKELFPDTRVTVCTNANFEFSEDMLGAGLSQIIFAIDGMDQSSYVPYRVYGEFDQAYRYMQAFSSGAHAKNAKIQTVWKYVLFKHNDSPEQLLEAQRLAAEAQVTELRFIITQLGPSSTGIVEDGDIPRANNGVNVQVQNYKVSIGQLDDGIRAARESLGINQIPQASQSALFVASMMRRLFDTPRKIPTKFVRVLSDLRDLASKLPDPARSDVIKDVEHLSVR